MVFKYFGDFYYLIYFQSYRSLDLYFSQYWFRLLQHANDTCDSRWRLFPQLSANVCTLCIISSLIACLCHYYKTSLRSTQKYQYRDEPVP